MFIYRFTNLIKSKLLWGFLAVLMVFAFVVMDSCSGPSADSMAAGFFGKEAVSRSDAENANQVGTILTGDARFYLPQNAQILSALLTAGQRPENWAQRKRMNWKLLAAYRTAKDFGLDVDTAAAQQGIMNMFAGQDGAFNPAIYRAFLSANNYTNAKLFEDTYRDMWFPSETLAVSLFNAIGWASPMEQSFALDSRFDESTVYAATLKQEIKPETIPVADATAQAWYNDHQAAYTLPEQRVINIVEIPTKSFGEKLEIADVDAMQYHDDHSDEFQGTDTNGVKTTLPFEQVKDQAIAKVRAERALEEALNFANEDLLAKASKGSYAEAVKAYGEPKVMTLRQDIPPALQKGNDVLSAAFEMDTEDTPIAAVAGQEVIYFIQLTKVIAKHVQPFAEVKADVLAAVRKDEAAKLLVKHSEKLRETLLKQLETNSDFAAAVAACNDKGFSATTAMTFVVNDAARLDFTNHAQIVAATASLGVKAISEPITLSDSENLLVYVASRKPGDPLAKATARPTLGQNLTFNTAFQATADWFNWNLEREPPVISLSTQTPVLLDDETEQE